MISPYRNEINALKGNVIASISQVEYSEADEQFDKLSFLFLKELVFYSRNYDETLVILNQDKEMPEGERQRVNNFLEIILNEFTKINTEWKEMIDFQEKWGTIR